MTYEIELKRLLAWAVLPTEAAEELLGEPELSDALTWAETLPTTEQNELLAAVAAGLSDADAAKASALLVFGGRLVEKGAEPNVLLPSGLQHSERLRLLHEQGASPTEATWRFAVIGLMAHLCRSAANRALLKKQTELPAWLDLNEELSDHFVYLLRLFEISDEDVLWILFPNHLTGLEVSISQINNTFHLLTLLQPLVLEQAENLKLKGRPDPTDAALLDFAAGKRKSPPAGSDYVRFEWLNAAAYQGGPLDSLQLAWGEAPVSALPRVRGNVVLLATENEQRVARSWDAGFLATMHDANRPEVRLRRVLPAAEVRRLLDDIHTPVTAPAIPAKRSVWQRLRGK